MTLSGESLHREVYAVAVVRRLQALGAYVRIAEERGRAEYLDKIAPTWVMLADLIERGLICRDAPALAQWLARLAAGYAARAGENR